MKGAILALFLFLSLAIVLPGLALAETTAVQDLRRGMPATVDGMIERITDDDGPLEFYATEVTLPDGKVVPLPNRD